MPRTRRYIFNTLMVVSLLLLLGTAGLWVDSYWNGMIAGVYKSGDIPEWEDLVDVPELPDLVEVPSSQRQAQQEDYTTELFDSYEPPQFPELNEIISASGRIQISRLEEISSYDGHKNGFDISRGTDLNLFATFSPSWAFGDFQYYLGPNYWSMMVPHWFLTLTFAIVPAIWLFKRNKRRKLGPNACASCGYDLTGNETGNCPECGTGLARPMGEGNPI